MSSRTAAVLALWVFFTFLCVSLRIWTICPPVTCTCSVLGHRGEWTPRDDFFTNHAALQTSPCPEAKKPCPAAKECPACSGTVSAIDLDLVPRTTAPFHPTRFPGFSPENVSALDAVLDPPACPEEREDADVGKADAAEEDLQRFRRQLAKAYGIGWDHEEEEEPRVMESSVDTKSSSAAVRRTAGGPLSQAEALLAVRRFLLTCERTRARHEYCHDCGIDRLGFDGGALFREALRGAPASQQTLLENTRRFRPHMPTKFFLYKLSNVCLVRYPSSKHFYLHSAGGRDLPSAPPAHADAHFAPIIAALKTRATRTRSLFTRAENLDMVSIVENIARAGGDEGVLKRVDADVTGERVFKGLERKVKLRERCSNGGGTTNTAEGSLLTKGDESGLTNDFPSEQHLTEPEQIKCDLVAECYAHKPAKDGTIGDPAKVEKCKQLLAEFDRLERQYDEFVGFRKRKREAGLRFKNRPFRQLVFPLPSWGGGRRFEWDLYQGAPAPLLQEDPEEQDPSRRPASVAQEAGRDQRPHPTRAPPSPQRSFWLDLPRFQYSSDRPVLLITSEWFGHLGHTIHDLLLMLFVTRHTLGVPEASVVIQQDFPLYRPDYYKKVAAGYLKIAQEELGLHFLVGALDEERRGEGHAHGGPDTDALVEHFTVGRWCFGEPAQRPSVQGPSASPAQPAPAYLGFMWPLRPTWNDFASPDVPEWKPEMAAGYQLFHATMYANALRVSRRLLRDANALRGTGRKRRLFGGGPPPIAGLDVLARMGPLSAAALKTHRCSPYFEETMSEEERSVSTTEEEGVVDDENDSSAALFRLLLHGKGKASAAEPTRGSTRGALSHALDRRKSDSLLEVLPYGSCEPAGLDFAARAVPQQGKSPTSLSSWPGGVRIERAVFLLRGTGRGGRNLDNLEKLQEFYWQNRERLALWAASNFGAKKLVDLRVHFARVGLLEFPDQQRALMSRANVLIGVHGAGLAQAWFQPVNGSRVVDISWWDGSQSATWGVSPAEPDETFPSSKVFTQSSTNVGQPYLHYRILDTGAYSMTDVAHFWQTVYQFVYRFPSPERSEKAYMTGANNDVENVPVSAKALGELPLQAAAEVCFSFTTPTKAWLKDFGKIHCNEDGSPLETSPNSSKTRKDESDESSRSRGKDKDESSGSKRTIAVDEETKHLGKATAFRLNALQCFPPSGWGGRTDMLEYVKNTNRCVPKFSISGPKMADPRPAGTESGLSLADFWAAKGTKVETGAGKVPEGYLKA